MSDVISMMAGSQAQVTPTAGAMVVLVLLMALRVVRALQRESPDASTAGSRARKRTRLSGI